MFNCKRKGFTLIELLVVIAIIAILAAILFPVFAQARQRAKLAGCQSNVKQIGLAAIMYANDHNDSLPGYGVFLGFAEWNYGGGSLWTSSLLKYVKSAKIFRCPTDTGMSIPDGYASYNMLYSGVPLYRETGYAPENFDSAGNPKPLPASSQKLKPPVAGWCTDKNSPGTSYTYNHDCGNGTPMSKIPAAIRKAAMDQIPFDPNDPRLKVKSAADVDLCHDIWYWHLGDKKKEGTYKATVWLDGHVTTPMVPNP